MNNVALVGRLTKKPELRFVGNSNIPVTNLTLAVDRTYDREKTDFINIETWNKQAENCCKYLDKGSLISIDGSIRVERYETKAGEMKTITKVVASKVNFLSKSKKTDNSEDSKYFNSSDVFDEIPELDASEVPF